MLKPSEKRKYRIYADEINEEREKIRDIYELIYGIKPRKPYGAYKVFIQEKLKEKVISNLEEANKLWNELSQDKKDEYIKKSHRRILAYKYKQMIYQKKSRKFFLKDPFLCFLYF